MKDKERNRRFDAIRKLLPEITKRAHAYAGLMLRVYATKPDGSLVGEAETESDERAVRFIAERFPDDSVVSEEHPPLLRPGARFCFFQDPLDGTEEVVRSGLAKNAGSVLQAYADCDAPFAFGVGEVTTGRCFTGNVEDGVFLDGAPYRPPERECSERFLLWIDHHAHSDVLMEMAGSPTLDQAGVAIRLLLYGYLQGGIIVYEHLHEAICFEAVVRTMGGTLTPVRGSAYRFWEVFSLPGVDHEAVLQAARRSIWKKE